MEGLWGAHRYWRQDGYCYQPNPDVVHVYFPAYPGLAHCHLHDPCLLDEYETLHEGEKKEPHLEPVRKTKL